MQKQFFFKLFFRKGNLFSADRKDTLYKTCSVVTRYQTLDCASHKLDAWGWPDAWAP